MHITCKLTDSNGVQVGWYEIIGDWIHPTGASDWPYSEKAIQRLLEQYEEK
jgi:hypothetical protein